MAAPIAPIVLNTNEMDVGAVVPPAFDGPPPLSDTGPPKVEFADVLTGAVSDVAVLGHDAHSRAVDLAEGRVDDLHGTMIATKKAEISLHLIGSVRNKVLDAFHELWRMNV